MEDRKEEIKQYLSQNVNPLLQPMLQKIAQQRPKDIILWISTWFTQKLDERQRSSSCLSDSDNQEQNQVFMKKLQQMKNKKKKKNSRQAISAQCFGQFNKKSDFAAKIIKKSSQTQQIIKKLLKNTVVFKGLQSKDLETVVDALQQIQTSVDETIIKEGNEGDMLFIVFSGEYQCSKVINGNSKYLKTYYTGEAFGQLSLMYNSPRQATIKCVKKGILYGLDRPTFINIVQQAAIKKRKVVNQCISRVGILADIQPYQKEQLCDALKAQQFEAGQYVVRQGQSGDKFFLVAQGCLIAEKRQAPYSELKKVFDYKQGDYFGEIALVKNTVRQASIRTQTKCKLMSIDRQSFKRLLGPIEDILMRNMERYKKYLDQ